MLGSGGETGLDKARPIVAALGGAMDAVPSAFDAPPMIDITTEQLLPLSKIPGYLEQRGLGRRVNIQSVHRWAHHGAGGVVLESIRIGGTTVTSVEALQRWVVAREHAQTSRRQAVAPNLSAAPTHRTSLPSAGVRSNEETNRILMNHRLMPTPLDNTLASLGMNGDLTHVGNLLHRAGLRSDADVARMSKAQLLALPRLGPFGREVVARLKARIDGGGAIAE